MADPERLSEQAANEVLEASWERLFGSVRRARVRYSRQPPEGLSLAQWLLIGPLLDNGALSVGELADGAGVTAPTASRMLDLLAGQGLVERRRSTRDARTVEIVLTGAGEARVREKFEEFVAMRESVFAAHLTASEREQAAEVLRKLGDALEQLT